MKTNATDNIAHDVFILVCAIQQSTPTAADELRRQLNNRVKHLSDADFAKVKAEAISMAEAGATRKEFLKRDLESGSTPSLH